jgi:hypothetical protein
MFARVSTYRGETNQLVDGFRRTIAPLEEQTGFVRALFLGIRGRDVVQR